MTDGVDLIFNIFECHCLDFFPSFEHVEKKEEVKNSDNDGSASKPDVLEDDRFHSGLNMITALWNDNSKNIKVAAPGSNFSLTHDKQDTILRKRVMNIYTPSASLLDTCFAAVPTSLACFSSEQCFVCIE